MTYITKTAIEVIEFVKSKGIEVRFSSEDSFRSDLVDLLSIYQTVDKIGVNRVGIADTVGCANPRQVYDLVRTLRGVVGCDIEIHLHNDTGMGRSYLIYMDSVMGLTLNISHRQCLYGAGSWCNAYRYLCVSNAYFDRSASDIRAPAVLGIGERVGITPLGGLIACLYAANPEYVKSKYNLSMLREIENLVAEAVEVNIPFMNPITYVITQYLIIPWLTIYPLSSEDTVHLHIKLVSTPKLFSITQAPMRSLSLKISV
jgi:homocitrate synthase